MTTDELKALTDQRFEAIVTASDGSVMFALPIPGYDDLGYTVEDGRLTFAADDIEDLENAWAEYVGTLETKRRNRTRKLAAEAGAITEMPKSLAVITLPQYQTAMTTIPGAPWGLQPITAELAQKLRFRDGKLYFEGQEANGIDLVRYYDKTFQRIRDLDLPTLQGLYSVILREVEQDLQAAKLNPEVIEAKLSDPQYIGHSVTIRLTDFLRMLGKDPYDGKSSAAYAITKIKSYEQIIGRMEVRLPGWKTTRDSLYPVMVWHGYHAEDDTISFASPYINHVIMTLFKASIQRDKQGKPKLRRNGQPFMLPAHSYLVKSTIAKERNKRAVAIVCVIVPIIEQAGDNVPRIRAQTIVDRVPDLKNALEAAKTSSDKNKLLKTAFSGAWRLLETQTRLRETYKDIRFPTAIPTPATLRDLVFEFPHGGKVGKTT